MVYPFMSRLPGWGVYHEYQNLDVDNQAPHVIGLLVVLGVGGLFPLAGGRVLTAYAAPSPPSEQHWRNQETTDVGLDGG